MNKWVIWAAIGLVVLGIVVGIGIYVFQSSGGEQESQNQGTETSAPGISGEILNGMFDALEEGLNG